MSAAVYHGNRDIRIARVPVPTPGPGELLIEVGAVGICGTDSSEWASGPHQYPITRPHPVTGHRGPMIPGHEFSGTVVGLGDDVDPEWLGTHVASCGSIACGTCARCREGRSNHCPDYAGVGLHRPGALAELVAAPAETCLAVPDLSSDEAALCQPMAVAVHAVARAGDIRGRTVLVQGAGAIGVLLTSVLARSGARVVVRDLDPGRTELARRYGAEAALTGASPGDWAAELGAVTGGRGPDVVFEATGSAPGLATALELAPRGSRVVLVGIQDEASTLDLGRVTVEEKMLIGTNAQVRETDFPRAVDLVRRGRGTWHLLAPRVHPLDELVSRILAPLAGGRATAVKTLVDPRAQVERSFLGSASLPEVTA